MSNLNFRFLLLLTANWTKEGVAECIILQRFLFAGTWLQDYANISVYHFESNSAITALRRATYMNRQRDLPLVAAFALVLFFSQEYNTSNRASAVANRQPRQAAKKGEVS